VFRKKGNKCSYVFIRIENGIVEFVPTKGKKRRKCFQLNQPCNGNGMDRGDSQVERKEGLDHYIF